MSRPADRRIDAETLVAELASALRFALPFLQSANMAEGVSCDEEIRRVQAALDLVEARV